MTDIHVLYIFFKEVWSGQTSIKKIQNFDKIQIAGKCIIGTPENIAVIITQVTQKV